MKSEVENCKSSNDGVHSKNETLQSCKEYLEEQVDALVRDVKSTRGVNEKVTTRLRYIFHIIIDSFFQFQSLGVGGTKTYLQILLTALFQESFNV